MLYLYWLHPLAGAHTIQERCFGQYHVVFWMVPLARGRLYGKWLLCNGSLLEVVLAG